MMRYLILLLLGIFLSSCVPHIAPYRAKERKYVYQGPAYQSGSASDGSLWSDSSHMNNLFTDNRGLRIGDLVTLLISESSSANSEASTESERTSSTNASVPVLFNFMNHLQKQYPNINPAALMSQNFAGEFAGAGKTVQKGTVAGRVTATVKQVLPTGNYFIEGQKVIMVNNEEQHFYISGVIRPVDVNGDNEVFSSRLAEAHIEFTGRGSISSKQKEGWLSRVIDTIWPF